jgi:hypothetical protein
LRFLKFWAVAASRSSAWAPQPQAPHRQDPLEMGKQHLDALAVLTRLLEGRRAGQSLSKRAFRSRGNGQEPYAGAYEDCTAGPCDPPARRGGFFDQDQDCDRGDP